MCNCHPSTRLFWQHVFGMQNNVVAMEPGDLPTHDPGQSHVDPIRPSCDFCFSAVWQSAKMGLNSLRCRNCHDLRAQVVFSVYGYGSIPINTYKNTIFRGMNIHFNPAILM